MNRDNKIEKRKKLLTYIFILLIIIISCFFIIITVFFEENDLNRINNKKIVALTFDDGPGEHTSELIKILEKNNALATFFLIGTSVESNPNLVKELYLAGHELAIHSYNHSDLAEMSIEESKKDIDMTKKLIESAGGKCSAMIRPPYGSITDDIIKNNDMSFILWSVDSRDWEINDKETIKKEVELAIKDGSIILFHEIFEWTIEVIEEILPLYSDEYEFVTVTELFEKKQKNLEINKVYRSLEE